MGLERGVIIKKTHELLCLGDEGMKLCPKKRYEDYGRFLNYTSISSKNSSKFQKKEI